MTVKILINKSKNFNKLKAFTTFPTANTFFLKKIF